MNTVEQGAKIEDLAANYLEKNGLSILHRNFKSKLGEIDIIAQDRTELVFVEIRYRKSDQFGSAAASVNQSKQNKIIRCAQFYLQTRAWAKNMYCRFDVIAASGSEENPMIDWIKDAFHEK